MIKLDIVIVTFNRLDKLKKTLAHYQSQTVPFRTLIVVNNHSTDGTDNYLKEWQKENSTYNKHVITLNENRGGAGGFHEGQKYAMTLNPDWIYVSDDDAYPNYDMIERFYNFIDNNDSNDIAAICAAVYNIDESIAYDHRSHYIIKNGVDFNKIPSVKSDYNKNYFEIDLLSYVGSFINTNALAKVGFCEKDLFIFYDDTEHSIRLSKYGKLYCCPSIIVKHDSGISDDTKSSSILISWREYYYIRNKIHMLKKHHKIAAIYLSIKYLYSSFKSLLVSLLKPQRIHNFKIIACAICDAWTNHLGKHKKYQPGFYIYNN